MLKNIQKNFYQKTGGGVKVWNFYGNLLSIDDKTLEFNAFTGTPFSFKSNNLRYVYNNTARELQLISTSDEGLLVCEFSEGGNCSAGTEFLLSNRSPAKISLNVIGPGSLVSNWSSARSEYLFGNRAIFDVRPDLGASLKSITGCGGSGASPYITAEVRDECTITATFESAQ